MPSSSPKPVKKSPDLRRRRHPRYRGDFRVMVTHLLGSEYQNLEGHCRDLSIAGIGIILAAELNHGDVVGLNFSLPGSPLPWNLRAVVRYRRGCQYGIEFLSLPEEQRISLERYFEGREAIE